MAAINRLVTYRYVFRFLSSGFDLDVPRGRLPSDLDLGCLKLAAVSEHLYWSPSGLVITSLGLAGSSQRFRRFFLDEKARRSRPRHSSERGSSSPAAARRSSIERPDDICGTGNSITIPRSLSLVDSDKPTCFTANYMSLT